MSVGGLENFNNKGQIMLVILREIWFTKKWQQVIEMALVNQCNLRKLKFGNIKVVQTWYKLRKRSNEFQSCIITVQRSIIKHRRILMMQKLSGPKIFGILTLHKEWNFPLRISSVNVTNKVPP